jgi:hypothetical protein
MVEALAVRQALAVTRDKDFKSIILASDCIYQIQKIQARGIDRSSVGTMVGDIKRLSIVFSSRSCKHVRHLCNGAVHNLARSFELSFCELFIDEILECI